MSLDKLREGVRNRERAKGNGASKNVPDMRVEQPDSHTGDKLKGELWFERVRKDRETYTNQAIDYYKRALNDATPHIVAYGHLQTLAAETPGLAHFYKKIHTDAQQIRKWLEEQLEIETASTIKWLRTSPEAKQKYGEVGTQDAGRYAKAEQSVVDLTELVRLFAYYDNLLGDVVDGFTNRAIMINHLTIIRQHGLEEVWIDSSRETSNE